MVARLRIVTCAVILFMLTAIPAFAHGDVAARSPEDGATVDSVPRRVSVTLTESPVPESTLHVRDGCRRRVATEVSVEGDTIVARISADAQPGAWRASWEAISAVDGHPTEGGWSFDVSGSKDCSRDEPTPEPTEDGDQTASPSPHANHTPTAASDDDEESSFPVMPVGLGAIAVIGIAFFARRAGTR